MRAGIDALVEKRWEHGTSRWVFSSEEQASETDLLELLRQITTRYTDKTVRQQLAARIAEPGGIERLAELLPPTAPAAAPTLAYLAAVTKDHSHLSASVLLIRQALALCPGSASFMRMHMHMLELQLNHRGALLVLLRFCETNPQRRVRQLTCARFAAGLSAAMLDSTYEANPARDSIAGHTASNAEAQAARGESHSDVHRLDDETGMEEVELLSAFLTAVRLLFTMRAIAPLSRLLRLVEPVRDGMDPELLSLPAVHSENAFLIYITTLLPTIPSVLNPDLPVLHVVGDSHCLSPAWRTISVGGEPHLVVPRLITGLKVWHLRSSSTFYTKAHFDASLQQVPDGSLLVFLLGFIDCREGLPTALEHGVYQTLEEGVDVLVQTYVDTLGSLCLRRGVRIFVHPVPPVIEEMQEIVALFNCKLRAQVMATSGLMWLAMFDHLTLVPKDLQLDGLHLHPQYLPQLEQGIEAHSNPAQE